MPYCGRLRWHKTQEEADACVKHLDEEDFDNLSTLSRTRSASRRLSSGPKGSGRKQTASPAATPAPIPPTAPTMDQQDNQPVHDPTPPPVLGSLTSPPMDYYDGEGDRAPAIDQYHDRTPETPPQQTPGAGASKVPEWLENVGSDPDQVPHDNIDAPNAPETPLIRRLSNTTPPRDQRRIRKGRKAAEQDRTPSKDDVDERPPPAGPERAWYQEPNFLMTKGAAIWGGVGGLLFMICIFGYAMEDATRFP
jgi:hypothetical protein